MSKPKLKQYLRNSGCIIESHSKDETFLRAGNFILGKWNGTNFVVESKSGGTIILRVKQSAAWHPNLPPCQACSQYMGAKVPTKVTVRVKRSLTVESYFVWEPIKE